MARRRASWIVLCAVLAPGLAHAQRGVDDQIFKPSLDAYGIFGTERAQTSKQWEFGFRFYFNFAARPLHLELAQRNDMTRTVDQAVVDNAAAFHLGAHLGLTDRLELAFDIPMVRQSLDATGYGVPADRNGPATGFYQTDSGSNLRPSDVSPGDMRWAVKVNALRAGPLALGGAVIATLPFGDETAFLGTHSFTVEPLAVLDLSFHRVGVAINAGYRWHDGTDFVVDPTLDAANRRTGVMQMAPVVITDADELIGSLGALVHLNEYVAVGGEVTHLEPVRVSVPRGMQGQTSGDAVTDAIAGLQIRPLPDVTFELGGGLGVQAAARKEDFTVLAGLSWAPGAVDGVARGGDRDHDGIPDARDLCPDEPEDKDGFQDEDGCPDPDNDQDGIPDALDRCPNEPEDRDGFQDEDGCPDPDNDGDGIPDIHDRCPNQPEDKDGFEDEDGCPDPDNDGDGIPDVKDKCPNEPETFNGIDDEDGCPDIGVRAAFVIAEPILFRDRSAKIEPAMARLLDDIAGRIRRNPQIKLIRIEGHTDARGNAAAQRKIADQRAATVREYLIHHGVDGGRLQSTGYGASRPADTNSTREGRAVNRRVELIVVE